MVEERRQYLSDIFRSAFAEIKRMDATTYRQKLAEFRTPESIDRVCRKAGKYDPEKLLHLV